MRTDPHLLSTRLAYFAAVAEAGSVRGAARRLNIASSAVNRQLLMLEDALGQPLFERTGRAMRLTQGGPVAARPGSIYRPRVRRYRGRHRRAERAARRQGARGDRWKAYRWKCCPILLTGFNEAFPGIEIKLDVYSSDDVTAHVLGARR